MKPIIFSAPMVQAILEDRKSMTRRIIKLNKYIVTQDNGLFTLFAEDSCYYDQHMEQIEKYIKCPYGKPGDILWVRETWCNEWDNDIGFTGKYLYKADGIEVYHYADPDKSPWKSPRYMPYKAARLFLLVKNIRVERLQDITEDDAKEEGISRLFDNLPKGEYALWACAVGQRKTQAEQPFTNYLWHGHFGKYGTGNKQSDAWAYQYSAYKSAVGSFSSLWELINAKRGYGWDTNPWVWVIEFERTEKP